VAGLADLPLDVFAPLSHKRTLTAGDADARRDMPPWMDEATWRRLWAYRLRRAYTTNVSRFFLVDDGSRDEYREYGDAALIRDQAMSACIGREQTIAVDGADDEDQVDTAAADRQTWLEDWADAERLPAKMVESERQAAGLGDSVYVLGWSGRKKRPRLQVYDPGLYHPVLDEAAADDDYPSRVHLLWEIPPPRRGGSPLLRRRTWELGGIAPLTEQAPDDRGVFRRFLFGVGDGQLVPQPGDQQLPDGRFARVYPWAEAGDEPSTVTCYYTDATWELNKLRGDWTVDTLPLDQAQFGFTEDGQVADRLDLRIDFLPVVHVPNNVAGAEHFGQSVIDMVAQLIDDLSMVDTDVAGSATLAGTPVIGLAGATLPQSAVQPDGTAAVTLSRGQVWSMGAQGRMDVLDTSGQLAALRDARRDLLSRLSENARVPEAILGRVKASEVPSGFALQLMFSPFDSLIGEMRLVRGEKYALLLKFVQRLAQAGGDLPAGPNPRAEVRFGPYLPADMTAVIDQVVKLLAQKALSLITALRILQTAGVQIDDVEEEQKRIESSDLSGAQALFEATGDDTAVRARLGLGPRTAPPAPDLNLDVAGGAK
jgi:hypothetical protein